MAVDDYLEPEVAVAAAATAALFSPRVRGVMRKGLVYGTAGVMTVGDAVASVAKGAGRGAQRAVGRGSETADGQPSGVTPAQPAGEPSAAPAGGRRAPRTSAPPSPPAP